MSSRNILIIGLILLNIVLDQVSKFIVRADVIAGTETEIFGQYFTLHNVENKGAFLGMGSDFSPTLRIALLLVLPIVVLALVLRHIIKDKTMDTMTLVGFCCIIGGGIANVYDRIVYGSVTDFLHIDLGGVFRTGIFNIADVSVMVGMGCLIVGSFIKKKA
ncbi:signal peptidase II [Olleya sp. YSTF-M6]|uniref:Lipoprotein signal peptidase n=1 Tax=Olleya sediminilitoris TaxID=2795739 RepID=A0ABS1WNX6_9FLAO|nr:signal peptidase II [Olleya sediminilitoris]MBL7560834.1 signal peptidase II [Olleya sediminilitoris]